jgi:hypothetical protein
VRPSVQRCGLSCYCYDDFFFYFSFLLFSILSGVHAGTFYMTSRGEKMKEKADKIQLSRESFDRSRLEVESNSKSCETVN